MNYEFLRKKQEERSKRKDFVVRVKRIEHREARGKKKEARFCG